MEKVKVISILLDSLHVTREISVRQCNLIKFSKGGHFFAISSGSSIFIYNTFTGVAVSTLRGHNSRIRSLMWLHYDSRLLSVGQEGAAYYWDIFPAGVKRQESFSGTQPFVAVLNIYIYI
jgi:WD40 repeat protein